jgi:hypothetical protein
MKRIMLAALISCFAAGTAFADNACTVKAVGKDGKALSGAAKTSSMKKCCEASAIGKDGKKLVGAAFASYTKKCEAGE